uniref:PEST proteolytic signal-containing nuclear protein n=1 Tax=Sus scrofa TaxID=9823 RepID=A0A8D1DZQ8_PIG
AGFPTAVLWSATVTVWTPRQALGQVRLRFLGRCTRPSPASSCDPFDFHRREPLYLHSWVSIPQPKHIPPTPQTVSSRDGPEEEAEKPVKTKTVSSSNGGESSSRSAEKRSAEEEAADLPTKPTKISKFGFAIGSQTTKKASAISIKLGSSKPKETVPTLAPKTLSVAAAFNEDEDSEPEEMPPEAKMRMKNIGRYYNFCVILQKTGELRVRISCILCIIY